MALIGKEWDLEIRNEDVWVDANRTNFYPEIPRPLLLKQQTLLSEDKSLFLSE